MRVPKRVARLPSQTLTALLPAFAASEIEAAVAR